MALIHTTLLKLQSNPKESFEEAARLLIKIADNILKDPTEFKHRALKKKNKTIASKILSITGGLDCLKLMGFEEDDLQLVLPPTASLENLQTVRNQISEHRDEFLKDPAPPKLAAEPEANASVEFASDASSSSTESCDENESANTNILVTQTIKEDNTIPTMKKNFELTHVPKIILPPLIYMYSNPLLRNIETHFHVALAYDDKPTQQRAKSLIPITKLELTAQKRLRQLQEQVKKGAFEDPNVSLQDMMILVILAWFKEEFFVWVDNPKCEHCGGKTNFSHMSTDLARIIHTPRVEMHVCLCCSELTPFPRYNDVNLLLLTRRGRCGEWANTFTLICRAMGWDARYVVDEGDHVWTEVYSIAQKRWIHCDPCENACDSPLVYEHGWGKKLSYVIAYSSEEVQDVTWRYSSNHEALMKRRVICSERELIDCLIKLRNQRQINFTPARRQYLTKRLLLELIELMAERKSIPTDEQGRTSGSLSWRINRGEVQGSIKRSYSWTLAKEDLDGKVTIKYSAALDRYEYVSSNDSKNPKTVINGWHAGVLRFIHLFRKEEKDWKMVYLARTEGERKGSISWKFTVDDSTKVIDVIDVKFDHRLYEDGSVEIEVQANDLCIKYETGMTELKTLTFSGCKSLTLTAYLSGGRGNVAWQHAQLFRQPTKDTIHYPFSITFTFKNK